MAQFSRLFPFLDRLFPPQGQVLYPRDVSDSIYLTHEIFRPDIKHQFYLTTTDLSILGTGVNAEMEIVPEPAANFVNLCYASSIFVTLGDLFTTVQFRMEATGTPQEGFNIGAWGDLNGFWNTIRLPSDRWTQIPMSGIPVVRGNRISTNFITLAVGATARVRSLTLQVPLQCVDFVEIASHAGSGFNRNTGF